MLRPGSAGRSRLLATRARGPPPSWVHASVWTGARVAAIKGGAPAVSIGNVFNAAIRAARHGGSQRLALAFGSLVTSVDGAGICRCECAESTLRYR